MRPGSNGFFDVCFHGLFVLVLFSEQVRNLCPALVKKVSSCQSLGGAEARRRGDLQDCHTGEHGGDSDHLVGAQSLPEKAPAE